MDADGNGEIDFDEFCACMKKMTVKKATDEEIIKECFLVFDQVMYHKVGLSKKGFYFFRLVRRPDTICFSPDFLNPTSVTNGRKLQKNPNVVAQSTGCYI